MLQLDWDATINTLRETLPQTQFQNWVKPVEFIRSDDTCVVLGVPSRFHEEWLRNHYSQRISQAIRDQCGAEIQLEFEILARSESQAHAEESPSASARPRLRIVESKPAEHERHEEAPPPIEPPNVPRVHNPFFPLSFNHVAYQCVAMFADRRELQINPLVILGGVGMGKTHLLSDLGNRVFRNNPEAQVRYTNAESFTNEMYRHLKSNDMLSFKRKYGELTDCLLFDDVQGLTKRMKTQEALLHIFNDIMARGGQVAFTSSVSPSRLEEFVEPLKSRLLSGVVAEIKVPGFDDKLKLLGAMAAHNHLTVETAVLHSLADKGQADVRELVGTLLRVHLQAKIENRTLDGEFLAQEGLVREIHREAITMAEIVALVEHNFGVNRSDMFSKSRKGNITWARQVAMFLARTYTLLPLEEIGKTFGRDHATVIHAFQKVTETMEQQPTRRYEVEFLKQKLQARSSRTSPHDLV
jgi:chromosomal replication initiator protein